MKIGQVEFTWRAHRQACVVKIGGEQRVFRFNKKTTRKELFAKIRSLIAEAAGTQKVCQHCGKHYFGVNSHNFLCGDCAQKAADIHREGVGNIKEFSFFECKGFQSDDVCINGDGNACVRVLEKQLKPAAIFGNKTVKYRKMIIWDEDEL